MKPPADSRSGGRTLWGMFCAFIAAVAMCAGVKADMGWTAIGIQGLVVFGVLYVVGVVIRL